MSTGQRQFAGKPRKKNMLNDYRQPLPCSDEPMPGSKYPAQLMWEQKANGNIVLKIADGVFQENAKGNHKEAEMVAADRNILFQALLDAADNPNFGSKQIAVRKKQFVFQGGQRRMSDQPVVQCYLTISRNERGVTLGYSKGDYKVLIRFRGPNDSTVFVKNEAGERMEDHGLMSRWAVKGYVGFHQPILDQMELTGWEPPKPRGEQGGGGDSGGGYGGGNGGNGGYSGGGYSGGGNGGQSAPAPQGGFDEDIPF